MKLLRDSVSHDRSQPVVAEEELVSMLGLNRNTDNDDDGALWEVLAEPTATTTTTLKAAVLVGGAQKGIGKRVFDTVRLLPKRQFFSVSERELLAKIASLLKCSLLSWHLFRFMHFFYFYPFF
ncbi:unnamed protein product [Gongylonema pulchrum]|uniref:Uncharacterized protein n=1 Tax=Gongylonema pulchrum TaxID=637853 RepID=A0A183E748_9BILA|nr:unnamed protein product [Gongylonema pulchrum]